MDNISIISTDYISSMSSSSMSNINNNIMNDDKLINLIKEKFSKEDMELFKLFFNIYKAFKNNKEDFIVDLDEVYEWIGYSNKANAKKSLLKYFKPNIDYMIIKDSRISLIQLDERDAKDKTKGGDNKQIIKLTIKCFKNFCMVAETKRSDQIYDYYITMEEVINNYIENKNTRKR